MDNIYEPQVAVIRPSQVHLVTLKLWHATAGLYLWEFFTTLDYEWGVIRGRLPYRWTIWIYVVTRVAALLGMISCIAIMDITTPINCQLWTLLSVILFCLSSATASLLIVLRTIAIWKRNKAVLALAITVWVSNVAFHLQNVIRIRSVWVPAHLACETDKTDPSILTFISTITSDMVLLLFALAGLLVMHRRGGTTFGLTRLIWKQGVIWLILGAVAEIPPVVLTFVHLNDPFHALFQTPGVIIIVIGATRMQRSLVNFASSDVVHESPQVSDLAFEKTKQTDATSTVPDRVEVTVHKTFGQHPTGSMSGDSTTILNTKSTGTWPVPAVSSSHRIPETQSV